MPPAPARAPANQNAGDDQVEQIEPTPTQQLVRRGGEASTRAKTLAGRLTRAERAAALQLDDSAQDARPETRGECCEQARPCPWVSCAHHLYLDVNPESGAIKFNFPHLEVWEMAETCSLDVADRGGITLEEVGDILNLTRERIRQVEVRGLLKLKMDGEVDGSKDIAVLDAAAAAASADR